jgi:hypothetical protein
MPTTPASVIDEDGLSMASILLKLTAMEKRLTSVEESNMKLKESNMELRERLVTEKESNMKLHIELRENNDRLEATMQTTMEAVIGVRDIGCIYIITYFACRIALQSTRSETKFFSTWLGLRISWLSSVLIRIGVTGRTMPTRTRCLFQLRFSFKTVVTIYLTSGKPFVVGPQRLGC